jgi:hypothetical protein
MTKPFIQTMYVRRISLEVKAKAELRKAAANWDALSASLTDFEDVSEE